jgi:hypothetical protein
MIGSCTSRSVKQTTHDEADAISAGHIGRPPITFSLDEVISTDLTINIVKNAAAPILLVSLNVILYSLDDFALVQSCQSRRFCRTQTNTLVETEFWEVSCRREIEDRLTCRRKARVKSAQ